MNPIENVFGFGEQRLEEEWIKKRSASADETLARFRDICAGAASSGDIERTCGNMPERLRLVIEADGGPIKY